MTVDDNNDTTTNYQHPKGRWIEQNGNYYWEYDLMSHTTDETKSEIKATYSDSTDITRTNSKPSYTRKLPPPPPSDLLMTLLDRADALPSPVYSNMFNLERYRR